CNGHGRCEEESGRCRCNGNWEGDDCSVRRCPRDCSGHGECINGRCRCDEQWAGKACRVLRCLNGCSSNGKCRNGTCECSQEWTGPDCSAPQCPNDCSSNGQCVDGRCRCWGGWDGISCSEVVQPSGLQISNIQPTTIDVSWTKASSALNVALYFTKAFLLKKSRSRIQNPTSTVLPNKTSVLIKDLSPGETYTVALYAVQGENTSAPIHINFTTSLDAPASVEFVDVTSSSATVRWAASVAKITGYQFSLVEFGGLEVVQDQVAANRHSFTFTQLKSRTRYNFTIYSVRDGTRSLPLNANLITGIDKPTHLRVQAVTPTSVIVTWNATQANVEGYSLECIDVRRKHYALSPNADELSTEFTNLRPATEYNITVQAELEGKSSSKLWKLTFTTLPPPAHVKVSSPTFDDLVVIWQPVYVFEERRIMGIITVGVALLSDTTSTVLEGLEPGTEYLISVFTIYNERGSIPVQLSIKTAIDPPSRLMFVTVSDSAFTIHWQKPVAMVSNYIVTYYRSSAGTERQDLIIPGGQTVCSIHNLVPATEYTVEIYAMGNSSQSDQVAAMVVTLIPSVRGVNAMPIDESTISVHWKSPLNVDVDSYSVQYRPLDEFSESREVVVNGDTTSTVMTGLLTDTQYAVTVSPMLGELQAKTRHIKATTASSLESPDLLRITDIRDTSAHVSWDPVIDKTVTGYSLRYKPVGGSTEDEHEVPVKGRKNTSYMLMALRPGILYYVSLATERHERVSFPPVTERFVTSQPLTAPPVVEVQEVSETWVTLGWASQAIDSVEEYHVTYSLLNGTNGETSEIIPASPEFVTARIEGLLSGRSYIIQIRSFRWGQDSPDATSITVTTLFPLLPPRKLILDRRNQTGARITWTPNTPDADGHNITLSRVRQSRMQFSIRLSSKSRVVAFNDLLPGTRYRVTIATMRGNTTSKPQVLKFKTDEKLAPPTNISVSLIGETGVNISWIVPSQKFDRIYFSYTSDDETGTVTISSRSTQLPLEHLKAGTTYNISVTALGRSKESFPLVGSVTTLLNPPSNLNVTTKSSKSVELTWKSLLNDVDGYVIKYHELESRSRRPNMIMRRNMKVIHMQSNTTVNVTGLLSGKKYVFQVVARKDGRESYSMRKIVETEIAPPQHVKTSVVSRRSANLTWEFADMTGVTGYLINITAINSTFYREYKVSATKRFVFFQNLFPGHEYDVDVATLRKLQKSSSVQVHFKTAKVPYLQPKDCVQVSLNGEKSDDVYEIFPYNGIKLKVFCDLTTDGGGWIVFQRRRDGSVSFDRSWEDYTTGFGNLTSEFWIGLQTLHELTTAMDAPQSLRIDLHHGDDKSYAAYHNFSISNSDDRFVLSASNYSGTAGDSLSYHYGMKFTTYDSDNDEATRNCAKEYKGAWWFKNCHRSSLNGQYGNSR
uniref:Tenascin-R n=1 Tax=Ciona savignyi TaxID=51511 RepID=H2YMC0_CIOSA